MSLQNSNYMIFTFLNIHNNKNNHSENHILSQLSTETPVPAVISHQEFLKLIKILSSFVNMKKL